METQMHVPEGTEDNQRHEMSGWFEVAKERMGAYGGSNGRDRIARGQPNTVCTPPSTARHCCFDQGEGWAFCLCLLRFFALLRVKNQLNLGKSPKTLEVVNTASTNPYVRLYHFHRINVFLIPAAYFGLGCSAISLLVYGVTQAGRSNSRHTHAHFAWSIITPYANQ
jgi:hypothetical protein